MVNHTLGNLLCCICSDKKKVWNLTLAQAEFAYNNSSHDSIKMDPFAIVYREMSTQIVDLITLQTGSVKSVTINNLTSFKQV